MTIPDVLYNRRRESNGLTRELARNLLDLMGKGITELVYRFVEQMDLESLGLLGSHLKGYHNSVDPALRSLSPLEASDWRTICYAPAAWLECGSTELEAFAHRWLAEFRSTPELALEALNDPVASSFIPRLSLGDRQVALVKLASPLASAPGQSVSSVFSAIVRTELVRAVESGPRTVAAVLELDPWPFQIAAGTHDASRGQDPRSQSLLDAILDKGGATRTEKERWLQMYATAYGEKSEVLFEEARKVMGSRVANLLSHAIEPLLRGWLDDETARKMYRGAARNTPGVRAFGGQAPFPVALASLSRLNLPLAERILASLLRHAIDLKESFDAEHRDGTVVRAQLVHYAAMHGSPKFLATLLQLGCDPSQGLAHRTRADGEFKDLDLAERLERRIESVMKADPDESCTQMSENLALVRSQRVRTATTRLFESIDSEPTMGGAKGVSP